MTLAYALALALTIPHIAEAPRLEDFESMEPATKKAAMLARIDGFIQREPVDGAPASERTEVYVGYDSERLYAVFVCFDSEPDKIRARMSDRESILDDDFVTLQLDTFSDQRRAYVFGANPHGIQRDAVWIEAQGGFDATFDTVWESRARLTPRGYIVWMAVPFRSLRFPSTPAQSWGVLLTRDIPRRNEQSFWPRNTRQIKGTLNQMGRLDGLSGISPGRNLQLISYVSMLSSRGLDLREPTRPQLRTTGVEPTAGFDGKAVLKDSLVLDVTVNPDFSQVGSDEPQSSANQRFELFFPEKRPFFLENASYFDTPFQIYFTRRIVDPRLGVRLTGKAGHTSLGLLAADDEAPGRVAAPSSPVAGLRARILSLRVSQDVYEQSSVGAFYLERRLGGGSNQVTGVDARLKLGAHWVAVAQALGSRSQRPDGPATDGVAHGAGLDRAGTRLVYHFDYGVFGRDFRSELGFLPRLDFRKAVQSFEYSGRPGGRRFLAWNVASYVEVNQDTRGVLLDWVTKHSVRFEFARQTSIRPYMEAFGVRARPAEFRALSETRHLGYHYYGFDLQSAFVRQVSLRADVFWGRFANFVPASGAPPTVERDNDGIFTLTLRPTRSLRIDNTYLLTRLKSRACGERIFTSHVFRSKWNYQFTRALSLRATLDYSAVLANPRFTSLETTRMLRTSFLATYLTHPGTAIFAGWSSRSENIHPDLVPTSGGLLRTSDGLFNHERQLFVKVSYLKRW